MKVHKEVWKHGNMEVSMERKFARKFKRKDERKKEVCKY